MAITYEPIASTTLTANADTVTLSNIPNTFDDLRLVIHCKYWQSYTTGLRFNNQSSTVYSTTRLESDGSGRYSNRNTTTEGFAPTFLIITGLNTDPVANVIADIFGYKNTSTYTTVISQFSNANKGVTRGVGLYHSTSSVSSLTILGSFATGSTFSIYGIKAA